MFQRSSVRPSVPDDAPRRKPFRTVRLPPTQLPPSRSTSDSQLACRSTDWESQVEVLRPFRRSVSWSTHVEVFIIPARERTSDDFESKAALDDCDPRTKSVDDDDVASAPSRRGKKMGQMLRSVSFPCEDDTSTPCHDPKALKPLETKCDTL